MVLRGAVEEGVVGRDDALRVGFLPGRGQVMQFFFRDERTPADSANINGMVFRRRPGS